MFRYPDYEHIEELKKIGKKFSKNNKLNQNTPAVQKVEKLLKSLNIPFDKEDPLVIEQSLFFDYKAKLYLMDFYIPSPFNFVIEVDGGYHNDIDQKEYDKNRDLSISGKGYGGILRLTNEEILKDNFSLIKAFKKKKLSCFIGDNLVNRFIKTNSLNIRQYEYNLLCIPINYYIENIELNESSKLVFDSIIDRINHFKHFNKYYVSLYERHLYFLHQVMVKYTDDHKIEIELADVFDQIFIFLKDHIKQIEFIKMIKQKVLNG